SCGSTTSGRMDVFAPRLLDLGLGAMIGKGERNLVVRDAISRNGAVYLCAIGGAGALAARCIKSCEVVAFEDLGCESVKKLWFEKFPLVVANDPSGGDIFETGRKKYARI
ncbi:MAG TPA: fumarate hydratase C-terminal domain-containing protein, partial [Oscillospiraceae bacterium]|nr:fumarate hydratase C-terminal domain-containing protein [Oscillospiraceae bacterium]